MRSLNNGYAGCCKIDGNGFDNMTNVDHPSIYYSISCETMPFDNYHKCLSAKIPLI
ncbi:MAG: C25 family cysteine peptidase [Dysgonamonadaceae bacterium]|nr:C25 family cysteine peptidase [Dysgonamonadaceae bacterium]